MARRRRRGWCLVSRRGRAEGRDGRERWTGRLGMAAALQLLRVRRVRGWRLDGAAGRAVAAGWRLGCRFGDAAASWLRHATGEGRVSCCGPVGSFPRSPAVVRRPPPGDAWCPRKGRRGPPAVLAASPARRCAVPPTPDSRSLADSLGRRHTRPLRPARWYLLASHWLCTHCFLAPHSTGSGWLWLPTPLSRETGPPPDCRSPPTPRQLPRSPLVD